jgi:hypothetical protein
LFRPRPRRGTKRIRLFRGIENFYGHRCSPYN